MQSIQTDLPTPHGAKLQKLAREVGFEFAFGLWGNYLEGLPCAATCHDLSHELGHFLVAPKSRKTAKHFGLGHPAGITNPSVSYVAADREEARASVLGIALMVQVGAPDAEVVEIMEEHTWDEQPSTFYKTLKWLTSKNFITQDLANKVGDLFQERLDSQICNNNYSTR